VKPRIPVIPVRLGHHEGVVHLRQSFQRQDLIRGDGLSPVRSGRPGYTPPDQGNIDPHCNDKQDRNCSFGFHRQDIGQAAAYVLARVTPYRMLIGDSNPHPRTSYERHLANLVEAEHAIAFGYARTGLSALLTALGLGPGDGLGVSPITCKVVPSTLISLKLKLCYFDVSRETINLAPAAIDPPVKAVLFQHTYGNPAGAAEVARTGLPVIEDCAQCLPGSVKLTGIAAIYSNNLLKPLPAGSGGAVVTNDSALSKELRRIASLLPTPGTLADIKLQTEAFLQRRVLRPELYWRCAASARATANRCRPPSPAITRCAKASAGWPASPTGPASGGSAASITLTS
jgi:hypothetical protein